MSRTFGCFVIAFINALPWAMSSTFFALVVAAGYDLGRWLPHDPQAAFAWYRKAAIEGDPLAANKLGSMYYTGYGVVADPQAAVFWWRRSAETGYAEAEQALGAAYCLGIGVSPDRREANRWWALARRDGGVGFPQLLSTGDCAGSPGMKGTRRPLDI